ncbi:FtsK/SpoIIIE domain-containing protein [Microbacterium sp. NPDC008134]|uniref:FtsK/SpoIIIE domain-containing protein n=1 Tax=Microbacterium sp. NPDC008134 TaxID=3364183 RepID=UPI0036ED78EB
MTILHVGKPISLPDLVPMRNLLSDYDPSGWNRLDLGIDSSGDPQGIDNRYRAPHTLVSGSTGSSKTITLQMLAAQALTRGHEVVYINVAGHLDFAGFQPWMKHVAEGSPEDVVINAAELIERVYTELRRRFRALAQNMCGFWMDLPDDVRRREQIRPLTVIVDEFDLLSDKQPVSGALPSEEVERIEGIATAKAKLVEYAGQIARSGRAAGVHLVIGTQRVGLEYLNGSLRSNLTARILTVPPTTPPTGIVQRLMFDASAGEAELLIDTLRSGHPGLAIVQQKTGCEPHGVRVGYAHWEDIAAILEELNVPRANPGFPEYTPMRDEDD